MVNNIQKVVKNNNNRIEVHYYMQLKAIILQLWIRKMWAHE